MNKRKKFLIKIIIFLLCIVVIVIAVRKTMSRYQSETKVVGNLSAAMYIVDEKYQKMDLNLGKMVPRVEPYIFEFQISNSDGKNRAEVNLEYLLKIVTTTNLPLKYNLYMNEKNVDEIISDVTEKDEFGTYFRTLTTNKCTFEYTKDCVNTYKLYVYFPEVYKDEKYQDLIEGIQIQINSTQIME